MLKDQITYDTTMKNTQVLLQLSIRKHEATQLLDLI